MSREYVMSVPKKQTVVTNPSTTFVRVSGFGELRRLDVQEVQDASISALYYF